MVGKSIYDGSWYLVEEAYRQGALVEGGWPRGRNGKEIPEIIKASVEPPPIIIEKRAANEFGFFKNSAANTGIIIPDTINEYECSINCKTLVIFSAISKAKTPTIRVSICEYRSPALALCFFRISVKILPDAAIKQLSAVDIIAEK